MIKKLMGPKNIIYDQVKTNVKKYFFKKVNFGIFGHFWSISSHSAAVQLVRIAGLQHLGMTGFQHV